MRLFDAIEQQEKRSPLLDYIQALSNTAASTVSGPIDLIAMGLRAAGVPVPQDAVLSSEWMARRGLTKEVPHGAARVLAETTGLVAPAAITAKAPQVAAALNQAARNAEAPRALGFAAAQRGALIDPSSVPQGPQFRTDLGEYADKIYRQSAIEDAELFMPQAAARSSPMDYWFASEPEYALGQGLNRGALMEFDAPGIKGQLSMRKPAAEMAYRRGNAEFIARDLEPSEIAKNLRSLAVDPSADKRYLRRLDALAKSIGWTRSVDSNGRIRFQRPE